MEKIAVIYWSQTGNTKAMAEAVAEGAQKAGAQTKLVSVAEITPEEAAGYDKLALGCPAMGDEVLEETEFEPFFLDLEGALSGKKAALFGSYGWGDGQWMRDWQERAAADGIRLYQGEGLIVHETPEEKDLKECRKFGEGFAAF